MKLLDSTISNELLFTLFNEMKDEGTNYVTLGKMMREFDVYKIESKLLNFVIYFNLNNILRFHR